MGWFFGGKSKTEELQEEVQELRSEIRKLNEFMDKFSKDFSDYVKASLDDTRKICDGYNYLIDTFNKFDKEIFEKIEENHSFPSKNNLMLQTIREKTLSYNSKFLNVNRVSLTDAENEAIKENENLRHILDKQGYKYDEQKKELVINN